MLGKLLKFEMRASARTLLPLYVGTLLVALACGLSMYIQTSNMTKMKQSLANGVAVSFSGFGDPVDGGINTLIVFTMILVVAFCVAVTVLTIMSIVQRFNNGIAGNEGYLMFTLPVSHEKLLASKLIGALLWTAASLFVIFLVAAIVGGAPIFANREFFDWSFFWEHVWEYFSQYDLLLPTVLTVCNGVLSIISNILMIYLAIMIGQTEQCNKHRVAVAVVVFFVLNWLFSVVESGIFELFGFPLAGVNAWNPVFNYTFYNYTMVVGWDAVMTALLCVACFFGTTWMMKKKLNL